MEDREVQVIGYQQYMAAHAHAARGTAILNAVARLHLRAFPGFFLSRMGVAFVSEYYRAVTQYERGVLVLAVDGDHILGFAAGFAEPQLFYRSLKLKWYRFVMPVLGAVLRQPVLIWKVVERAGRTRSLERDPRGHRAVCELSSLAVAPELHGRGFGRILVERFAEDAKLLNALEVRLTTDGENNDRVNQFYQSLGFVPDRLEKRADGRVMQHYVLKF
jgi:ribosomal protein S18 acetylase RimI-like enzyme